MTNDTTNNNKGWSGGAPVATDNSRSAQLFEAVFDHSPALIAYLDPQFNFIRVNEAYARADAGDPAAFVGKNYFALYPNVENEAIFRRAVATGEAVSFHAKPFEYAGHPERGVTRWDWTLTPIEDDTGAVTGLLLLLVDVTERIKMVEALTEGREHYRYLLESANAIPWEADPQTWRFAYVGPQAVAVLGYPRESWYQAGFWVEHIHPDDREWAVRFCKEATGRCANHDFEYRMLAADGRTVWLRDTVQVVCQDGRPTRMRGLMFDITARKHAEEELHSHVALLREVVNNAPLVLWAIDKDGTFTLSDGKGLDALGLRPGEVVGRSVSDVYGDNPQVLEYLGRALAGESFVSEVAVGDRVFESHHSAVRDAQGALARVIGVSVDITERKRTEHALEESELKYRELVDEAASIILRWDTAGNVTFFNEFAQQFFGFSEDEIIGRNVVGTIVPEQEFTGRDLALLMKEIRRDPAKFEYNENENIKRSGERVWIAWKNKPVFDGRGQLSEVLSVGIDITARKRAEDRLRASEQELSDILDSMQDTYYRTDNDGRVVKVSPSVRQLLGYAPEEVLGKRLADFYIDPRGREAFTAVLEEQGGVVRDHETALRHKDGSEVWVATSAHYYRDAGGAVVGIEGVSRDVTERRRAEAQMRQLSGALQQTADAVMITGRDGVIQYVNPAFEAMTGYTSRDAIGKGMNLVKSGQQDAAFYENLWSTILAGNVFSDVLINRRRDGRLYYEEKTITPLKDGQGTITHFVATGKDITERMQTQERLKYLAHHDVLTGLPNRALFADRLAHALARMRGTEKSVAVLFLDLDRFKIINDTLGHAAGDRALCVVSERLQAAVRESDTVARLGGDEFAIVLEDVESADNVAPIARKVLAALANPFQLDGQEFFMTASIGISLFPFDGKDAETLLKHADIAMYRAKEQGRNTYQFYLEAMGAKALQRLNLETSLRHALDRGEFVLHYQPQVDVATGRVVAVEALLRWQHPDIGLIAPRDFIPILEETGLVIPVGEWVLGTACAQARTWGESKRPLRVAVNLSSRQFGNGAVNEMVGRALRETGIDPGQLEIEMTESALIQHTTGTMDTLLGLDALGVRLALDDFGTGYSSLSYLKRFPVHTIKIDRSFTRDIASDPDDAAIVQAIIAMARSLGLVVIGEGVETQEQLTFLREQGCGLAQGFLFSHAVPAGEIAALFDRGIGSPRSSS